jgi:ribosomal protein L31
MKKFQDLNIKYEASTFTGDKIKITKILNRVISVHAYKIEKSKFGSGQCLYLQIEISQKKHIVFTGSTVLIEMIQQVDQSDFPFETTIVQENEMYVFT